jgi:hypothetical protein
MVVAICVFSLARVPARQDGDGRDKPKAPLKPN